MGVAVLPAGGAGVVITAGGSAVDGALPVVYGAIDGGTMEPASFSASDAVCRAAWPADTASFVSRAR